MTFHAEDALGRSRIAKILDLPLAVPAFEAISTECLIPCEDGQILDLISARTTTICAIVADEGSIAKKEEIRIRVEECTTGITSETVDMPSISRYQHCQYLPTDDRSPKTSNPLTQFESLSFLEDLDARSVNNVDI